MRLRIGLIALSAIATASSFGAQLWYNGDFDNRNGFNVGGFANFDSRVYDDFNVTSPGWIVQGVYMNVLSSIPQGDIQTFSWEIRQGVGQGTGGTLVANGTGNATVTTTGRNGFGRPEYNVLVSGLNVVLTPGTYFLGGKIGGNGSSNDMFVSTTSGANAIGTPPGNNDNSWWDSTSFGFSWENPDNIVGAGTWDLSMGVNGVLVPEPATMIALGLGAVALVRRRRAK